MTAEPLDLAAIRARVDAVDPAPWTTRRDHASQHLYVMGPRSSVADTGIAIDAEVRAHATFIAHARTDIPALLAEVERLRAEVDRFRGGGVYQMFDGGGTFIRTIDTREVNP